MRILNVELICQTSFDRLNAKQRTNFNTVCIVSHNCIQNTRKMAKQPILKELEYFVNGATTASTISPSGLSHLVHCGLNLLHNLPASKDAVFEYFTIFLDASVAGYVKLIEVGKNFGNKSNQSYLGLDYSRITVKTN